MNELDPHGFNGWETYAHDAAQVDRKPATADGRAAWQRREHKRRIREHIAGVQARRAGRYVGTVGCHGHYPVATGMTTVTVRGIILRVLAWIAGTDIAPRVSVAARPDGVPVDTPESARASLGERQRTYVLCATLDRNDHPMKGERLATR